MVGPISKSCQLTYCRVGPFALYLIKLAMYFFFTQHYGSICEAPYSNEGPSNTLHHNSSLSKELTLGFFGDVIT